MSMDYSGQRFGALAVVGPLGGHHKVGRHRRWVVRWDCCGGEQIVSQWRLDDRRVRPVALCPVCLLAAGGDKALGPVLAGAIRHPQWGLVWPLTWHPPAGFESVRAAREEWCA
jgi:hypothetical protein